MVKGCEIPIENLDSLKFEKDTKNQVRGDQIDAMDKEVQKLLTLGVIQKCYHEKGEIISPVFLVPKPDGSFRLILNLKEFNQSVEYQHFKMENLKSATQMMTKGCFMASADLRHAYYSVSIKPDFRKYLKFSWKNQLYRYTCFPNGLACCPRFFTKLLKPVYANLRLRGHLSACYIDDSYLQADSFQGCLKNVQDTVKLFQSLGFVVHEEKSVLTPTQKIKYLGFWLDSKQMTVSLSDEKKQKIKKACSELKRKRRFTIRELAQVIGILVSSFPGVLWGPLFYRNLDRLKSSAVELNGGNFEALTQITAKTEKELDWWVQNVENSFYPLETTDPVVEIKTDAATSGGWGVMFCGSQKTGGRWSVTERELHINVLELKAIELALKSFAKQVINKHVKVLSDNTTTVQYLRHMGGSGSASCDEVAHRIWIWCKENGVWLTVAHIPGKLNSEADQKSRKFNDRTEWKLHEGTFSSICDHFGKPDVDLFASRLNYQLKPFISWHPDPEACAVDAFTVNWSKWFIYAFPPFSVIQRVLVKMARDQATGIVVLPLWPTAVWYPQFLRMLIQVPVLLPRGKSLLQLEHAPGIPHPLHKNLQLIAAVLSGKQSRHKAFKEKVLTSSVLHGEVLPQNSMKVTLPDGDDSVLEGSVIPFMRLSQL